MKRKQPHVWIVEASADNWQTCDRNPEWYEYLAVARVFKFRAESMGRTLGRNGIKYRVSKYVRSP